MAGGPLGDASRCPPLAGDQTVNDRASVRPSTDSVPMERSVAWLLDRDPQEWRSALDQRYSVLDDVLAARRHAVVCPAARMGREAVGRLRSLGVEVVAFGDR